MKITNLKAMIAKVFTVGLLAGAVMVAAPSKANAQVAVGVRIGGPVYVAPPFRRPVYVAPAPVFYGPGFYGRYGWDRHEEFVRHERFEHRHGW